jgi:AraC-like DNA-binding protein
LSQIAPRGRPPAPRFLLNPRDPSLLGRQNAILSGSGKNYYVPDFEGCLSVKSVVSGSAVWEAAGRRFTLHENCYLILNDRQRYTMTIDSVRKVTTFCIFFRRGLVEDVFRSAVTGSAKLLDAPVPANSPAVDFFQKIEPGCSPVWSSLNLLKRMMDHSDTSGAEMEEGFTLLAAEIIREHRQAYAAIAKLPALRRSTQEELYRRALRGRDYLLSSLDEATSLGNVARAACMSPFHFHRVFTQIFGETPHRYLTRHRLSKAAHLLRHTNRSVTEICLEAGFESLGSFSSLFRRHFGVPPSGLRAGGQKSKIEEARVGAGI